MIRFAPATLSARANATTALIDADATPGRLIIYSGGRPHPWQQIETIPAHQVSTQYTKGDLMKSGLHYYEATTTGTTAASAPTFPTNGTTVVDGGVTWQDKGEAPKRLGTLILSQPAVSYANGVWTFNTITQDDSADTNGTASWARITDGDENTIMDLSVGAIGSGADVEINTTEIIQGGPIRVLSATITEGGI